MRCKEIETREISDRRKCIESAFAFYAAFLLANLLQALYGAVDLFVIGRYCGAESVAAVSTGTQVTQIITSLITGFTLAGTILVGKYTGMKEEDKVEKTIGTTISFFWSVLSGAYCFIFDLYSAAPVAASGA